MAKQVHDDAPNSLLDKRRTSPPLRVERRKLSELKSPPWNPRFISDYQLAALRASIEKWGYVDPIVVNEATGNVVGGNQRLKAMKALGYEEADVVVIAVPAGAEEKALNIALNKIGGDFEETKLAEIMEELMRGPPDLVGLTGFTQEEVHDLLNLEMPDFKPPPMERDDQGARLDADTIDVTCPKCRHPFTVAK